MTSVDTFNGERVGPLQVQVFNGEQIKPHAETGVYHLPSGEPITYHLESSHDCLVRVVTSGRPHCYDEEAKTHSLRGQLVPSGGKIIVPAWGHEGERVKSVFHPNAMAEQGIIVIQAQQISEEARDRILEALACPLRTSDSHPLDISNVEMKQLRYRLS
jgi:hypothetical protein